MGVGQSGGSEGEQAQGPGGGRRQRGVHQPERAVQRADAQRLFGALRDLAELFGDVRDGCARAGRQPAGDQHEGRGLPPALLGERLGRARVDGDADLADRAGQQLDGRARLQAAHGARADPGDPGQRSGGGGHDQAVRVVREQRVDLFRVHGVVEQDQGAACGEGLADRPGELVLVRTGRRGDAELVQEVAGGALTGDAFAARFGERDPVHPVGVAPGFGEAAGEFGGERGASGSGPAGDQQDPGAGGLAAGQGVQAGPPDVRLKGLQLPFTAEKLGWGGT